jgi:hypothetical protein
LELGTPEEVAASEDERDLDVLPRCRGDLLRDAVDDVRVDADPPATEGLTGQLEQDPVVLRPVAV